MRCQPGKIVSLFRMVQERSGRRRDTEWSNATPPAWGGGRGRSFCLVLRAVLPPILPDQCRASTHLWDIFPDRVRKRNPKNGLYPNPNLTLFSPHLTSLSPRILSLHLTLTSLSTHSLLISPRLKWNESPQNYITLTKALQTVNFVSFQINRRKNSYN